MGPSRTGVKRSFLPRLDAMTVPAPDSSERGRAYSKPPGSPQSPASSHGRGFAWRLLALAVLVPVASLSIFRAVPAQWPTPVVQLLSFTPWMVVPAVLALGLALAGRRVWVNAAAVVLLAAQLFWLFPLDAGRSLPGQSAAATSLTAMNINSEFGQADAAEIVRLVRENGVDLLTVQEHTQDLQDRLASEGLGSLLPHRISSPTDDGAGSAIYSAHPMQALGVLPDTPFQMPTVRLAIEDAGRTSTLDVTNVHALPPVDVRVAQWRSDLAALGRLAAQDRPAVSPGAGTAAGTAAHGGPAGLRANRLLIGDFNATYDHSEFRAVLDGGTNGDANGSDGSGGSKMVDVGTAAGLRLVPTWPMEGMPLPGITIDHLVTSPQIAGSGYAVHRIPGTDHAAVLATLRIPAAG
jgi:endonuclease/exonuclease/phosphatase (EEP) superfamily protein YafD